MKVITISREFGAGGHSIGEALSERLGIPFYDWDIVRQIGKEHGWDDLAEYEGDEEITPMNSFVRHITPISYDEKTHIYEREKQILLDLAQKGPCIILGRCSDHIMTEAGIDSFHVFLYADDSFRERYTKELLVEHPVEEKDVHKVLKQHDRNRIAYYERFSGRTWGECHNYNLMLDVGTLGYDLCVDLIEKAVKSSSK